MEVRVSLAHVAGDGAVPLLDETIGENLARTAARHPQAEAVVDVARGVRLDYPAFVSEVDGLARALLAAGVGHGDRVAVWTANRAESVVTQYATATIGAVLVGVNPAYQQAELDYVLRHAGVSVVLAAENHRDSDYGRMLAEAGRGGWQGSAVLFDTGRWTEFLDAGRRIDDARLAAAKAAVVPDDVFCLQYTSGTTGAPKGAVITHRSALNNGLSAGRGLRLTERDRLCVCLPFFHAFGIVASNLACTTHGAAIVISAPGFDTTAVLATVERERCTALHGVPTMFIAELAHPDFDSFDLSSLRTGIMGGSPCPQDVVHAVTHRMGMSELTVGFGMSELTSLTTQTRVDDPLERRYGTVGRPLPHLEARVVDADGRTVRCDEVGQLVVRGYSRMAGYWDDAEQTAAAIDADGWLHTGDLATIDAGGYLQIVGRLKDMVCRGGENVYPREIEDVLHRLPDVVEAQVVGVPDPKYGEEVLAAVHLRSGSDLDEDAVRTHCREHLAYYKVPRYVVFTQDFPRTASGKVKKRELRDALAARLGAAVPG
jgi:fatty-acyl-CoA synthase